MSLWRQSNRLVEGEKIWEAARKRDPSFTCAKLFWWYNMYATADFAVTPRPQYPADGRKLPDVYAEPPGLRAELQGQFGTFPLFNFWGPRANLVSTEWIARSALHVWQTRRPTLTLVYLPHLDYDLQRLGPEHPRIAEEVAAVDAACEPLLSAAEKSGAAVIVLSEYGITEVSGPVHINRALREAGLLRVRPEQMGEQLDPGASEAFAVADHQVAHVYVRRPERVAEVAALLRSLDGVEAVWTEADKRDRGLDHPRSGEIVVVSRADRWFTYYYWLDRRGGAGLRAHRRHPSQAGLRPGGALRRPANSPAGPEGGLDPAQTKAGLPFLARRDLARCRSGERLARSPDRRR